MDCFLESVDVPRGRVGLFGGTFNPVHRGHLQMARDFMVGAGLDGVWFMPNRMSPLKLDQSPVSGVHRLAMLRLAVEGVADFGVTGIELEREGASFTVDTVKRLQARFPEVEWVFLLGADSLLSLHRWRSIYELLALLPFYVAARPGFSVKASDILLDPPWPERLLLNEVSVSPSDCSSTEVRRRIAEGKKVHDLVAPSVAAYMKDHQIYV